MNNNFSFKVNQVRAVKTNIQYTVSISENALYFIKTGGQFADFKHLLAYFTPMIILSVLFTVLGTLYLDKRLSVVFIAIGSILGSGVGNYIVKRYMNHEKKDKQSTSVSPEETLVRDKSNFLVSFSEIKRLTLVKNDQGINGPRTGTINILGKAYDIAPGQQFEEIKAALEKALPGKIVDKAG